jgi:hypothetical protein
MNKNSDKKSRKPRKETAKARISANKRLAEQTRKLLGKHYASKYRAR